MMMHHLRRMACWLLLLPMALAMAPQHLLHECMSGAGTHAHGPQATTPDGHPLAEMDGQAGEVHADCALCHLNVVTAVPSGPAAEGWVVAVVGELALAPVAANEAAPLRLLASRGPPARA